MSAVCRELCIEIVPAFSLTIDDYFCFKCRRYCTSLVYFVRNITVGGTYDSRYFSRVKAVLQIVLLSIFEAGITRAPIR